MTIDHDRLDREIEEELRRRRAAGDLPPGLEQELHDAFAARAPRGALGADLDDLLLDVEDQSFFDTMAPLASSRPGGAVVKRTLRTLLGFYLRHVTTQMGAFAHATGRALRALAARVESLEQQLGGAGATGEVVFVLDSVPLLDGTYFVTIGITNQDGFVVYDWQEQQHQFEVMNPGRSVGQVAFPVRVEVVR